MGEHILQTEFLGDPNIGLYGFSSDKYCLLGNLKAPKKLSKILSVPLKKISILETDFIGMLVAGNSSKIMVSDMINDDEKKSLEKIADVLYIENNFSAIGNLVLMNDNGAVLSPLIKENKKEIEKFLEIPCIVSKIAGISVVGSVGFCTNNGCLLHPKTDEKEIKGIEKVLDVNADIGTISFGSPFVSSGIIANSKGFAVSNRSSGPEMGRVDEALGFI